MHIYSNEQSHEGREATLTCFSCVHSLSLCNSTILLCVSHCARRQRHRERQNVNPVFMSLVTEDMGLPWWLRG